ncbi:MAG: PD-(D/E)XK nuclease family protein [Muribaculaceae bacterium]|nr:PD-(D/E)XK nuclease family protein [Muribaculaceae bacterium]
MTPFLLQVARHYIGAPNLEDYCFVFPNRRSGQFFADYMQKEFAATSGKCPRLMPSVISINELVTRLTDSVVATDIEMIFALYEAYCQAMGDRAQDFDKFIYWAQLIIGDFNDIDRSLADAHAIYSNLDDLHSLSSNYLTADVKEKVEQIFGESLFTAFFDTSSEASLWQKRLERKQEKGQGGAVPAPDKEVVKQEFVSLWNALGHIYDLFHQALDDKGVISPGRQLRAAVEKPSAPLPYDRLVFVGFGVLSAAEVRLFDHFKQQGNADFWWDNAGISALLAKAPHDPGALLIDSYCRRFDAKAVEQVKGHEPQLRVMAVPSNVGQAKQAVDELIHMKALGGKSMLGIETAIVLPDEGLLVPLLHSIHGVERLNVTLGYPLRSSGIVSLMHIVARMHYQASPEQGVWTYYREDVKDILSHPLIKTYFTGEALAMSVELSRTNRFRVPARDLAQLSFHDLFTPAMDSNQAGDLKSQQADYLDQLMAFCNLLMEKMTSVADEENDEKDGVVLPLQQAFLVMYINILNQLKGSLTQNGRPMSRSTVFYLIDRLASSAMVPFTGEPLQGLQIMGLLETRSLDFENVVVLSMNERVFPRRHGINSFIPNYMRRAHGMSTVEQQEAIVSFNFYRLLNRARYVTLVYDSSSLDGSANEPSRYITQLEKVYGVNLERIEMNAAVMTSSPIDIEVPNPGKDALTAMYLQHREWADKWFLSASAINTYISCPLSFYLHYAQGLNNDNALSDFMDYGTFGTIIHDVLKTCYAVKPEEKHGHTVTSDEIKYFIQKRLEPTVVYYIKKHYLHVPEAQLKTDDSKLTGEPFMLLDTIKSYVNFVLAYDLELIGEDNKNAFTILECEKRHDMVDMEIGGAHLNFTYMPDRIDRLADGTVRIVDYKTGGDLTTFSKMNDLFDPHKDHDNKNPRRKAILQLFLYCYAYLKEHPVDKVQPVIYKITSMKSSGVKYNKKQFEFSMNNEVAQQFIGEIGATIKAIFSDSFLQAAEDSRHCNYCRFIDFCRRSVKESYY